MESTMQIKQEAAKIYSCYFCKTLTDRTGYCYGCGAYLCELCDSYPDGPEVPHQASAHLAFMSEERKKMVQKVVIELLNKLD